MVNHTQNQNGRAQEHPFVARATAVPSIPLWGDRQNTPGGERDWHRGIAARFAYPSFFIDRRVLHSPSLSTLSTTSFSHG